MSASQAYNEAADLRERMVADLTQFSSAILPIQTKLQNLQAEIVQRTKVTPITSKFALVDIPAGALTLIH